MAKSAAIRVLHTAAECFPLVKTGGLADVVAALPKAQRTAKLEARLLLPRLRQMTRHRKAQCIVADDDEIL